MKRAEEMSRGNRFVLDGVLKRFLYATAGPTSRTVLIHYESLDGSRVGDRPVGRSRKFDIAEA